MTLETPDTPEHKIKSILFAGLNQIILNLQPGDIRVDEEHHDIEPGTMANMQFMHEHTGLGGTLGVSTRITLPDYDLGGDRMQQLQKIIAGITGVMCSFGNDNVSFKGTPLALSKLLDRNAFLSAVKARMDPLEPGRG